LIEITGIFIVAKGIRMPVVQELTDRWDKRGVGYFMHFLG